MTLDDLPTEMVEKYRQRYRNATRIEKDRVESCLTALTCVGRESLKFDKTKSGQPSCQNIEKVCITSNTDFPDSLLPKDNSDSTLDDNEDVISSDRLAISYLSGDKWSPSQRRSLLECKIEHLLCQLPQDEEGSGDSFSYEEDALYIDIRRDTIYPDNIRQVDYMAHGNLEQKCVNGKWANSSADSIIRL